MAVDVIIGLQRGDEGKGRFVDLVAPDYDVIARGNGGANAGHTIVPENMPAVALHQIPSGIVYPGKLNLIGNGVYLDPVKLKTEIGQLQGLSISVSNHSLKISTNAHLVMPHHIFLDEQREAGEDAQGSTKSGIAFVAADKYLREGLRAELCDTPRNELRDLAYEGLAGADTRHKLDDETKRRHADAWADAVLALAPYLADTVYEINQLIRDDKNVLVEGAQAFGLDIDHGMYPYVTSSSTVVSGLLSGLGIAPTHVNKVTGVAKVIKSHVGGGPFVTEITDEQLAANVRGDSSQVDSEYGATTKRPRRVGYPDLPELRSAAIVNGVSELAITKADHVARFGETFNVATKYTLDSQERDTAPSSARMLDRCTPVYQSLRTWGDISGVSNYDALPQETKDFVTLIETSLQVPVTKIGVGPGRNQVIFK